MAAQATEAEDAPKRVPVPRKRRQVVQEVSPAPAYIADQVKRFILEGELRLGEQVTEKWLTDRFAASRTTVRDALSQLVAERYLDQEPYRSAHVRSYSSREMAEILESRRLIEGYAAEHCASANEADRRELQRAFAEYGTIAATGDQAAAAMAHVELHIALVGLTGNRSLQRLERELMIGSLLFIELINWSLSDAEKMYTEHMRLVNALLAPDPVLARELTIGHLSMVQTAVDIRMSDEPSVEDACSI